MIIFILKLGVVFCLILDDFWGLLLYLRWLNHWQIFTLLPRNSLIVLGVLFFGLIYALFDLFHLFTVGLLRLLSLIVLLYRLNSISTSNASVLMKVLALRVIRKFVLSCLLYNLFLNRLPRPEVISSNRSRLCPFASFLFLRRLIENFRVGGVVEDLLVLGVILAFPLLLLFLPYGNCLSATDLHGPYLICCQIFKQFDDFLLNCDSILVDLLPNQTKSIASFWFYPIPIAIHRCQCYICEYFIDYVLQ